MAFSTTANQIDLNNLTVGSLLIPGREETPSHPRSITESWHDGVCWTRSGPAVSRSHPGSLTSHSKTRGLTSQLNSTCSREHEYFCILPPELFRRGLIELCIKYNHGNFKQLNARILMKKDALLPNESLIYPIYSCTSISCSAVRQSQQVAQTISNTKHASTT